jgi:ubiquinol-cytochrome c reductase cytochrome c subunit
MSAAANSTSPEPRSSMAAAEFDDPAFDRAAVTEPSDDLSTIDVGNDKSSTVDAGNDDAEIEALEFGIGRAEETDDAPDLPIASAKTPRPARGRGSRGRRGAKLRRRLAGAFVILIGLAAMGGVFSMFAQSSGAQGATSDDIATGRGLYSVSCITCHGANLQGVKGKGVSLVGVGGAATYFQVSTGRMPLVAQGPDAPRKQSIYSDKQVRELAAYIQSIGGGTTIPDGSQRDDAHLAEGGELFRLNCASCHNFAGKGAPLSAGKYAPSLNEATDLQIATAMLTGPENMPVFNNNQLTPEQKKEIISYIQTLKASRDPGGSGLDRVGPVTEGLVIWVVGIGAMMLVILWIGAKS